VARGSGRGVVVLALLVVALAQVLALLQGVRSVRRLQGRVTEQARGSLAAARPRLDPLLQRGGPAAWEAAAALAIALGIASEVEVIDADGRSLYARPAGAPVGHALSAEERQLVAGGRAVTVTVQDGSFVRALSYLLLPAEPQLVLRLAASAGDLEDELRERQEVFLAQVVSLALLVVAVLLVARGQRRPPAAAPAAALDVYEQAMERLRDHGEEIEARHEDERRRMGEALREQEAMARAGQLTAGIVHEVRNGLGTIVGYARLLERAGLAEDPASAARAIREECDTLEVVVRRIADFVKLEELRLGPVDLARLLSRAAGRELRGREGVDVRFVGLERAVEAHADEELLERAVENVLRNALSAAAEGGGHVVVAVSAEQSGVEIRIEDDGPGLPAGHPGEIRPFYSTRPGGLGLGLPLARKVMVLHGGDLRIAPGSPRGVVVRLTLPAPATARS
jgi:signal transduction histidine kinase